MLFVPGNRVGDRKRYQVLMPAQLPKNLDIANLFVVAVINPLAMRLR